MSNRDHFQRTLNSFLNKLRQRTFEIVEPISGWSIRTADYPEPGVIKYTSDWSPIEVGTSWLESTAFFHVEAFIPPNLDGKTVDLRFDNQGESLLYVNGEPKQGFDPNRSLCRLTDRAFAGERYTLLIESCIRWQNYAHMKQNGMEYERHLFRHASFVYVNPEIESIYYDLSVLFESVIVRSDEWAERLLQSAIRLIKPESPFETLLAGVRETKALLTEEWFEPNANKRGPTIVATGHSHLDLAYLWPAKESVRKTGRTFSNMLQLLDRYPDFRFVQSQTAQYEYAKEHYPALYEKVKRYVAEGRWQLVGGMFVEPDCNLTSGESLVRQIQHGQRFFEREFGRRADICWLPDTFGYAAALPQLLVKSGYRYFYTMKPLRNTVNQLPFTLFRWEGLDGSTIVASLENFSSYNGQMTLSEIKQGIERFQQNGHKGNLLSVFGHGDGGGGVDVDMIERAKRYDRLPGLPAVKLGTTEQFFAQIERTNESLPHWTGEIYFEWHQGTYTSQARAKKGNRRCEEWLHDTELLSVLAGHTDERHRRELEQAWRLVLFNQFHDVLPGTSQAETFEQVERDYEQVQQITKRMDEEAIRSILDSERVAAASVEEEFDSYLVLNTLSFARSGIVELQNMPQEPCVIVDAESGEHAAYSILANGNAAFEAKQIPPHGYKRYALRRGTSPSPTSVFPSIHIDSEAYVLENGKLRVVVDRNNGNLRSIFDKSAHREVLKQDGYSGNTLELFDELYDFYDAWNIDQETLNHSRPLLELDFIGIAEQTPLAAAIRVVRSFRRSTIRQTIRLGRDERLLEFITEVDWQEEQVMLKAGFDLDIHATRATYDVAFGTVERSTRTNTSWEQAQHEVPAHRWADLSEAGYGAALINDCKYGYDCKHGKLRLTLLKAAKYPDAKADLGRHSFRYALYCHTGDWRMAHVDEIAQSFNVPLRIVPISNSNIMLPAAKSFLSWSEPGIFLSALTFADPESADPKAVILRMHENRGSRRTVQIEWSGSPILEVAECDLLEKNAMPIEAKPQSFRATFTPYEVKTFRLKFTE